MHSLSSRTTTPRDVPHRGESGFILVMTLMMLVVLIGLVGTVGVSAIDAGNTSSQVTLHNRAYAVANAGLQTALFRLNQDGGATGATGTLGNGTSYSYTVSALTSQSSTCAGLWVQTSGAGRTAGLHHLHRQRWRLQHQGAGPHRRLHARIQSFSREWTLRGQRLHRRSELHRYRRHRFQRPDLLRRRRQRDRKP